MPLERIKNHLSQRRSFVFVHSNQRRYLLIALIALVFALPTLIGYLVGISDYLRLGAISMVEHEELEERYQESEDAYSQLETKNSELTVNAKINEHAQKELRKELNDMQAEIKRLDDELLFYRHLHESDNLVEGLRVQSFELKPMAYPDSHYRFRSIVSFFSAAERNSFFEGYYEIVVEAQREGSADPELVTVTPAKRSQRKYKFKLIHTIKGEFTLEPALQPNRLYFRLLPKTRGVEAVEEIYSFEDLLSDSAQQY